MRKSDNTEISMGYSMPWANIMTRPGSTIMCSSTCVLSHCRTSTACLPGTRLQTYFSYNLKKRNSQFNSRDLLFCSINIVYIKYVLSNKCHEQLFPTYPYFGSTFYKEILKQIDLPVWHININD